MGPRLLIRLAALCLAMGGVCANAQESHYQKQGLIASREGVGAGSSATQRKLAPRNTSGKRSLDRPAPVTPATAIGTVVSSLAIVLGLFLGLVWFTKRVAPSGAQPIPKEAVELLGRAPLADRQTVQLVRVGNRLLLVALSAGTAHTLTEITDPGEVEHLAGLCRQGRADSASASFGRVLNQLATEPQSPTSRNRTRGAA
jgi:flagellar protein FliO/FliZ